MPLLLAFTPQNVFYTINNDVLSPYVLAWCSFWCCNGCVRRPPRWLGVATGFANRRRDPYKTVKFPSHCSCCGLNQSEIPAHQPADAAHPVGRLGCPRGLRRDPDWQLDGVEPISFRGSNRVDSENWLLGWTRKPFADWWQHPIFAPGGLWVFWSSLIASFWRGELTWHSRPLSWGPADKFFAVSSFLLLATAIVGLQKPGWAFRFPATGDWCCNSNLLSGYRFFGAALDSI